MSSTFKHHTSILPQAQKLLWPQLQPSVNLGFTLYGGTAIALRLGHRTSVDFDFFTEKHLDRAGLLSAFPFISHATVIQDSPDTLSILTAPDKRVPEYVKVSFFGAIDFGRVGRPDLTLDGVMNVASLQDLMATKVKVILQRVEAKDYRDLAALIDARISLAEGLAAARAMFGANFQPSESLKAMVYFEGGDLHTLKKEEKLSIVNGVKEVRHLPSVSVLNKSLR